MHQFDPVLSPATPTSVFAGVYRRIDIPAPGVGIDWQIPVVGGTPWRVLLIRSFLTTSAVVANRQVRLDISDGDATLWSQASDMNHPASNGFFYCWSATGPHDIQTGVTRSPISQQMPDVLVHPGWLYKSLTLGLDPGDQWSVTRVWLQQIEAWPSGPPFGRLDASAFAHPHRGDHRV